MAAIKEMPYAEKYAKVREQIELDKVFIPAFVQKHIGTEGVNTLQQIWHDGIKPVNEESSFEEKYETAYSNWIWIVRNSFSFVRNHMGEDGFRLLGDSEIEALKKKNAGAARILSLMRIFSPSTAFQMAAKQIIYQRQWTSPCTLSELTNSRAVFNSPRCKVLDFPDTDDICRIGCQSTYPRWFVEQMKLKLHFDRQGNSCTGTLTHLS